MGWVMRPILLESRFRYDHKPFEGSLTQGLESQKVFITQRALNPKN